MPEQVIEKPIEKPAQQEPVEKPPVQAEPDLITKVTQFKKQEPVKQDNLVDINFDFKELESIKDPVAKEVAMKAYKSMQAGATKKFQEASTLKKEAEEKLKQAEQVKTALQTWTPDRIQNELLTNPQFLAAAQQVSGTQENTDSLLSKEEREKITSLESEINRLKQTNYSSLISQEDVNLQSKFADYNPVKIDDALGTLARMQPHKLREYVYKATEHDEHVRAAYELGLREAKQIKTEKVNAFSVEGSQVKSEDNVPTKEKGESDIAYFIRLAQSRKAQLQK